ncbi:CAP domain-containing protein [Priestia megaterium]|uniref:CAP domain-containing protein n=1 Tax=Priestia megaterium TaxID=1404 RepID=UPI002A6A63D8|nr:CAP domain-containing protein [Priestia megaterium]MDY0940298.1 CAP domain-containing protein [Priestia megaterium]
MAFVYAEDYLPQLEKYLTGQNIEQNQTDSQSQPTQEVASYEKQSENMMRLIGDHSEQLIGMLGEPDRIDSSAYGYDWWIYKKNRQTYAQIGVENNQVVSVYVIGSKTNTDPFEIGEKREEVEKRVSLSSELTLQKDGNEYRFRLSEEDMKMRPIIKYGDVYVQLYFDQFLNTISSIRIMDMDTLLKQRPYEIVYRGELPTAPSLTAEEWKSVQEGEEQQIIDITNVIRDRFQLSPLDWDEATAGVAYLHSKEMSDLNYFSHVSPAQGDLGNRLQKGDVVYRIAGENIASNYQDGIAAVEGWLNSEGHRKALLNKEFTRLGVGVYEKYYTQNFITPMNE